MKVENIEDIYELTPIQKGILFHSLYAPELGLYFFQMPFVLRGNLNIEVFERSWQQVVDRHASLRTGFYWEDINKPLQVVYREVKVPLELHDWRGVEATEQQQQIKTFLERDRATGFDLAQDCLMRLTLFRLADNSYYFVWSRHFLIIDGWSVPLVIKDFIQIYEALCQGKTVNLVPSIPYRNYVDWLEAQDLLQAENFWRQALVGLRTPTPLINLNSDNTTPPQEKYDEQRIYLSQALASALQSLARQHQVTFNVLFQATWAILLSHYSGQNKIAYGCTVSGRPVELVGAESMVGLFVNTLPVWIEVNLEQSLITWLRQLQALLIEMRQYEYSPLVDIQGWSEMPRSLPLFESILVFENAPVDRVLRQWEGSLEVEIENTFYKTNYPLTVAVYPDSDLCVAINYDFRRFDTATIACILEDFEKVLQGMVAHSEGRLKDLLLQADREYPIALMLEKEAVFNFEFTTT